MLISGMEFLYLFLFTLSVSPYGAHGRRLQIKGENINGAPRRVARVAGGTEAVPHSHPWLGSVQLEFDGMLYHLCSAVLINEYWALSPAHCVFGTHPSELQIAFGEHDLTTDSPNEQVIRLAKTVIQDTYDPQLLIDDFALLYLLSPAVINDYVKPVTLGNDLTVFHDCVVAGWGLSAVSQPPSNVLLEAYVNVITNAECSILWPYFEITDSMICAGTGDGSPCVGDSGSPLTCIDADDGQMKAYGIVTFGSECGAEGVPEGFIRINSFRDRLNSITAERPGQCDIRNLLRSLPANCSRK